MSTTGTVVIYHSNLYHKKYAQSVVQGTIKNAVTGELLPFASANIKGSPQGTVSNEQGNFSLDIKTLPVVLNVSSIGYQPAAVTVSSATCNDVLETLFRIEV